MTPIRTDYSNVTYTAEGCFDLPATIASRQDGSQEVETVWELTDEELEFYHTPFSAPCKSLLHQTDKRKKNDAFITTSLDFKEIFFLQIHYTKQE